jgi:hypothetical protein
MPSIIQSFTGKYAFLSPLFRSAFFFDLGDHPKAATYDQFKTGHSEGLRHTH